jgi:Uma2 family endonuclease
MYLSDDKPAREPDLMIVLNDHLDRLRETYLDGIADLVVEIVSPESDERDHGKKFLEYEAFGIPEYWLIDPIRRAADSFALSDDRHYHRLPLNEQGRMASRLLAGFAFEPALLWRKTLPGATETLHLVSEM